MFLQNKPTFRSRLLNFSALGLFLCLVLILLTALFLRLSHVLMQNNAADVDAFLLLFLKSFSVLGMGFLGYTLLRGGLRRKRAVPGLSRDESVQPDFVIETFQAVLQQLKQKEEDLERLKWEAEERAKQVESYNENILESVPSGVLTFDREKVVTTFNVAAGRILDLSGKTTVGQAYDTVFSENPKLLKLLDDTLSQERNLLRQECELNRRDGKKIWLGLNASLLKDRKGQIIGATLVFTDLTEKKMLEEQVALRKRLVMIGEMSGWIAHEFRNYMGTILGYARLLEKKLDASDSRQGMTQSIIDELLAMETLITELLAYSKKTVVQADPVSLIDLFAELKVQLLDNDAQQEVEWQLSSSKEIPEVDLDLTLMRQSFANLIQNALDAMDGKGQLSIEILLREAANRVQISLSDTGAGISEEDMEKVFIPFFTTKSKGTGLGLALVHKIILSHNGHITVERKPEGGTLFTVILPVKQQAVNAKEDVWKQF